MNDDASTTRSRLRSAFAFRVLYLALAWLVCLVLAEPGAEGMFAALLTVLAWAIPLAAPLILWLDWRWLSANPEAVTRFGFRRRR